MANEEHIAILEKGIETWNRWRGENLEIRADLGGADLGGADLGGADLTWADLTWANLSWANLTGANLTGANLTGADFTGAVLHRANLVGANLTQATLVETNLQKANLTGTYVYGISAWNLNLEGATQADLIITPRGEPVITVDNLRVAQFIYLLLNNEEVRDVIDTITSKAVLILGRFTPERKAVLDALRDELRRRNYVPILFDFDKPSSRDLTETVVLLANMARFVVADVTDARSIPQELSSIVPNFPSVPVQPILLVSQQEYGMFEHWRSYNSVLPEFLYNDLQHLLDNLETRVLQPVDYWMANRNKEQLQVEQIRNLQEENRRLKAQIASADST